jgi:3-hydroxymyristoyl/3-hydroxydecanoyl-(acyl carrier protein) dehydratase
MPDTATTSELDKPVYVRSDLENLFLPGGEMLQVDRVTEVSGEHIVCELDVADHWVFPLHFPTDPIFPGTLLIEAAGQAIAIWAWHAGLRGRPRLIKTSAHFEKPVLPTHGKVTLVASVKQKRHTICIGEVNIFAGQQKVAEVQATLIIISQLDLQLCSDNTAGQNAAR